jgi:ADP-ribose pyrophosphatase YjhB (NUDIX family)
MEDKWLACARRLQAIAATGLHFSASGFDQERYRQILEIANEMMADLASVPIERIAGLVDDFTTGYVTPKIDVRGAVIEGERILLVQERRDGLWTLPGGFADVGLSAAENVVKEVREEAGLVVQARSLYSVRHKAKHPYDADVRDFYKLFFLCERTDATEPSAGAETADAAFFPRTALPALSRGRVIESDIEAAFAFRRGTLAHTSFD